MTQQRIVIVGASGYGGAELASLLLNHPCARIVGLFGSSRREADGPLPFSNHFPRFRGQLDLPIHAATPDAIAALRPDAVFLATPHEASLSLAAALREAGLLVLDLSGAFRLGDPALYPRHYGFEHDHPELLRHAVYGLPELNRAAIARANLIAVPGCYPTSAILPLAPLVRAGAIEPSRRPIIDATSGVSGAGRTPSARTHFCEVSQSVYGVLSHRHTPEISLHAGAPVVFTPHLGPYDRGILSTIHIDLAPEWTEARVRETLAAAYAGEPFVRLLSPGAWPSVAGVQRTNFCDVALAADEPNRHLILVSAIDNLVKGAAGQAIQCMNIRLGLRETDGLREIQA